MMREKKKYKYAHWFNPSTIDLVTELYPHNNCTSRSQFIEKAVLFYASYLSEKDSFRFLNPTLTSALRELLWDMENRIAAPLLGMLVEHEILWDLLSSQYDMDDEAMASLRAKCVEEVKRTINSSDPATVIDNQNRQE